MMPRESVRIYVPHAVTLRSGRVVRSGHYDATLTGDGALLQVKSFALDDTLAVYNEDLRERWRKPPGGARVILGAHEYEMAAATVASPIDTLLNS
jgi:hypothetical protein